MTITLNGTTGIQNVLGSAASPAESNTTNSNTGMYFPTSTTLGFSTAGTNAVTIDASQNVGIGTSSPTTRLTISGTGTINTATDATAGLVVKTFGSAGGIQPIANFQRSDAAINLQIGFNGANGDSFFGTTTNHNLYFVTNNTERMRIDSSGALILAGSTAQKATGTTWSNPSDQRLKDNIRDYPKGITELMQVRVREWEYNGKGGTVEGTKGLGVVADEIMVVLPNTVENYEAKLNTDDEEVTAIKKFDATEITWLLVKTVQEQQALITQLTDRIAALEAK